MQIRHALPNKWTHPDYHAGLEFDVNSKDTTVVTTVRIAAILGNNRGTARWGECSVCRSAALCYVLIGGDDCIECATPCELLRGGRDGQRFRARRWHIATLDDEKEDEEKEDLKQVNKEDQEATDDEATEKIDD